MAKEKQIIRVPTFKFHEMIDKLSFQELAEKDKAIDTVLLLNKEFIITGAMGSGNAKPRGYKELWGNRIEDISSYKGTLKPMKRSEHHQEIDLKRRERGYEGQIVTVEKREVVMCEPYTFLEDTIGQQIDLF